MPGQLHIALLRGINVGGKRRLAMADLAEMFVAAGCSDVRTYIQSGNVVFRATATLARAVPELIAAAVDESCGFAPPVMTRSAAELEKVAADNPFLKRGEDPNALHVAFLDERPGKAAVAALDPDRSPTDELAVRGREVYLFCPHGVGRTKLSNQYLEAALGRVSTMRNWRTVLKLLAMVRGEE